MSVKQNLFVLVFVHKCLMMLNDVEYTTFKMFVMQMSNYLFVISFQLIALSFSQSLIDLFAGIFWILERASYSLDQFIQSVGKHGKSSVSTK